MKETDPFTGTASGVMGAYYVIYIEKQDAALNHLIEQGHEIDRNGRIQVTVSNNGNKLSLYDGWEGYVGTLQRL